MSSTIKKPSPAKPPPVTLLVMAAIVGADGQISMDEIVEALDDQSSEVRSRVSTAIHELEHKGYLRFVGFCGGSKGRPIRIVEATGIGRRALTSINGRLKLESGPEVPRYPPGWRVNPMPEEAPAWLR